MSKRIEPCTIPEWAGDKELDALKRLSDYQAKEIEHKEPKQHHQFYYTEAIGDVFRELTKRFYATSYITEKTRKLESFGKDSGGDEQEKCEYFIENKEKYTKEVSNWLKKLNEFKEKIEQETALDPCRKEILLQIPTLQQDLVKWGIYYIGTYGIEKKLQTFVKDVLSRID